MRIRNYFTGDPRGLNKEKPQFLGVGGLHLDEVN